MYTLRPYYFIMYQIFWMWLVYSRDFVWVRMGGPSFMWHDGCSSPRFSLHANTTTQVVMEREVDFIQQRMLCHTQRGSRCTYSMQGSHELGNVTSPYRLTSLTADVRVQKFQRGVEMMCLGIRAGSLGVGQKRKQWARLCAYLRCPEMNTGERALDQLKPLHTRTRKRNTYPAASDPNSESHR